MHFKIHSLAQTGTAMRNAMQHIRNPREGPSDAPRKLRGVLRAFSRVYNKTLSHNALPTYQQVINTLSARFSTPNTPKRSLVCRATKPILPTKQVLLASQQRLVCKNQPLRRAHPPRQGAEKGWGRARRNSGLKVSAVKVFYFFRALFI